MGDNLHLNGASQQRTSSPSLKKNFNSDWIQSVYFSSIAQRSQAQKVLLTGSFWPTSLLLKFAKYMLASHRPCSLLQPTEFCYDTQFSPCYCNQQWVYKLTLKPSPCFSLAIVSEGLVRTRFHIAKVHA